MQWVYLKPRIQNIDCHDPIPLCLSRLIIGQPAQMLATNQVNSTSSAKILQVKILSKFKFYEILFAIGNGIKRGFQINKNFPCRIRKLWTFFHHLWVARSKAELNFKNILSSFGDSFSKFLFGVQGLKAGSTGHFKSAKSSIWPIVQV